MTVLVYIDWNTSTRIGWATQQHPPMRGEIYDASNCCCHSIQINLHPKNTKLGEARLILQSLEKELFVPGKTLTFCRGKRPIFNFIILSETYDNILIA